jgi:hypothetical protein
MIKKFSCGKILDKINFMSVAFSTFSRKISDTFLIKFDPMIGYNWKIELN